MVVVVAGTVVVVVATVVVVGSGLGVVVVDRGSVVRVVVVAPRVVVVVASSFFVVAVVVAVVVGGAVVVTTTVARGTVGAVVTVVPLTSALKNAVMRPEPGTANVVVVDLGEVAADAPEDAARCGAATTTDVGTGTNGTPVALSARTGASVGACE